MELLFRQDRFGWCTVYALANVLMDDRFLRFVGDEEFKGCSSVEVNKMLAELDFDFQIANVMYANQSYPGLPKEYVYKTLNEYFDIHEGTPDFPVLIYLLGVRVSQIHWHTVAVMKSEKGLLYVDPLRETYLPINSYADFEPLFIDCCQVDRLIGLQTIKISFRCIANKEGIKNYFANILSNYYFCFNSPNYSPLGQGRQRFQKLQFYGSSFRLPPTRGNR